MHFIKLTDQLIHHRLFIVFSWFYIVYSLIESGVNTYYYHSQTDILFLVEIPAEMPIKKMLLGWLSLWIGFKMIKSKIETKKYIYAINLFICLTPFILSILDIIHFTRFGLHLHFLQFIFRLIFEDSLIVVLSILSLRKINQEKHKFKDSIRDMKNYKKELIIFCVIYSLLFSYLSLFWGYDKFHFLHP